MRTIDFLRRIPIFHSVVENQSFSRAAEELGLTKSAVSANIKQLETELAVRLLNRSTRTVSTTEAGEELFATSGRIIELVGGATGRLGTLSQRPVGRIRVGTSVGFGTLHLMPVLADFHARFPEVEYDVVLEDQRIDPVKERMDLLIRFGPQRESGYVTRKLGRMHSVVCASPEYLEDRPLANEPADLAEYEWLLFDGDRNARLTLERGGRRESVRMSGRFRTNNLLALHEALRRGMGVAMVARRDVAEDLESGRLIGLLGDWTLPSLDIVALHPVGHLELPKIRMLLDFLSESWLPLD